jgi:hypothetical protein
MRRGVGYCTNLGSRDEQGCSDYAKGIFLVNHGKDFTCPVCNKSGTIVMEQGIPSKRLAEPYKEVRVEFNFDPVHMKFQGIAIVRDEAIPTQGSKYTLLSPLIKTENRALKVAEAILGNLQRDSGIGDSGIGDSGIGDSGIGIPGTGETIISLDDDSESFTQRMKTLGDEWQKSSLAEPQNPPKQQAKDAHEDHRIDGS